MLKLHPVVLSGGSGTRLWPLSRSAYPKQLLALTEEHTMLQATLARAAALAGAQPPILVCNTEHRFLVAEQCRALGVTARTTFLEPVGRNTAPAIALAALELAASDPDAIMLVLPADHVVGDPHAFARAAASAAQAAARGFLVTFGMQPLTPETGYGYIRAGAAVDGLEGVCGVDSFVEKPDQATAQAYLADGRYFWNSGMFVFQAGRYLDALRQHRPDMLDAVTRAWTQRTTDMDFCRPDVAAFTACPADSIDYAVMQVTRDAAVVPASFGWSDVGSWDSLWQVLPKDADGNAVKGDVLVLDSRSNLVRAESRMVALVGVQDLVVVETPDVVLVAHRDQAQKVKNVVDQVQRSGRREHIEHLRVYRPWGWYEGVDSGERFQVKHLMVRPGQKLSLQMHHHRAEHWTVVSGTALVTVGDKELLLSENQSAYIPLGVTHRLENPGKIDLNLVEVQSGTYLGEDDIVRFEDVYRRD